MELSEKNRSMDKIKIYQLTSGTTHETIIKSQSTTTYKS